MKASLAEYAHIPFAASHRLPCRKRFRSKQFPFLTFSQPATSPLMKRKLHQEIRGRLWLRPRLACSLSPAQGCSADAVSLYH